MEVVRSREGEMREEVISSGGPLDPPPPSNDPAPSSSSPPPTPCASSAGASSPSVHKNIGNADWFSLGQPSKVASHSYVGSHPSKISLSTNGGASALGSSQPPCRPWERGDLLRRLATFNPSYWSGKPKVASSLACAQRGWVNVDVDRIVCESCGANLSFVLQASWTPTEADKASEAFAKKLDVAHKPSCPWNGNICAESLVQFPPTPPSALIDGFKDRCDGLFQFVSLPVIAASAISYMRDSRNSQIDRLLAQSGSLVLGGPDCLPGLDLSRDDSYCVYSQAQKVISLCGWEPRWVLNVQDCEEHSAQSTRDGRSLGRPNVDRFRTLQDPGPSKIAISASARIDTGKRKMPFPESRCESRSPMLDCSLCGATVRIWDFLTVPRPARFASSNIGTPDLSRKMELTRGVSAASGISGWVVGDGVEKEQPEGRDEVATDEAKSTSNVGVDLNLTVAGVLESTEVNTGLVSEQFPDAAMGMDLRIGQPSGSEIGGRTASFGIGQPSGSEMGGRAASFESRGPSRRKRNMEGGGSTVDRPQLQVQQTDSVEGTVIDRDGGEVDDGREYSAGPSKRARDLFDSRHSSYHRDSSRAGPSRSFGFGLDIDVNRSDPFQQGNSQTPGLFSARDSTRASSVIAMDTIGCNAAEDSMESVENYPGDLNDVHYSPPRRHRDPGNNDVSEFNYSIQAQQSTCVQPDISRADREIVFSSTNDGGEILNAETVTVNHRNAISLGISGGSVEMVASHEAEIHGTGLSIHRSGSVVGEAEPIAEVTENLGQTGESAPDPGVMGEFVPEVDREDPHGYNHDTMSRSVERDDSGSKIVGSTKPDSVESGEKTSQNHVVGYQNSAHPSLSCNAMVYSGYEVSKEEVTQARRGPGNDEGMFVESDYVAANGIGPPNGESNYDEPSLFDPIKHHNCFCPWVNGNVAAAGSGDGGSSTGVASICGWQLTLDALDAFQSREHVPIQLVPSESAASLSKEDHLNCNEKLLAHRSGNRSHGNK